MSRWMWIFAGLSLLVVGEIGVLGGLYVVISKSENNNIHATFMNLKDTIKSNIYNMIQATIHTLDRDAVLYKQNPLPGPDDFNLLVSFKSLPDSSVYENRRWIPRIVDVKREEYEILGKQHYDSNFTIRDITFHPTNLSFSVTISPVRPYYFPLTLSVPPFTLTYMGGDFLMSNEAYSIINAVNTTRVSVSERITLLRQNNMFKFGTYLSLTVLKETNGTVGIDSDNVLGLAQILFLFSDMFDKAVNQTSTPRRFIKSNIYDITKGIKKKSLIYMESSSLQSTTSFILNVVDRKYIFYLTFTDNFRSSLTQPTTYIMIIIICITFLVIDLLIYILYRNHIKSLQLQQELTIRISNILNYVNHELRNPLHVITNLLKYVIDTNDITDSVKVDLNTALDHSYLARKIVEDASTLQSLRYDKLELHPKLIKLNDFYKSVHRVVCDKVRESNLIFHGKFVEKGSGSTTAMIDEFRLRQVIFNLVDNAIKYTKQGSVCLTMTCYDDYFIVMIQDTGIGIPINKQKDIFGLYVRSENGQGLDKTGYGLGLYIVKGIIDKMNGRVSCQSNDENSGTTFILNIPTVYSLHETAV
jgi:signal transduction histidine kinase